MATTDSDAPHELVRNADIAMYVAKARGKARYVLFAHGMQLGIRDRTQPEPALVTALALKSD